MKQRVLITGAAGTVGTALWQAWEEQDTYTLTLMDINPIVDANSRVAHRRYSRLRCDAGVVPRARCVGPSGVCAPRFAWEGTGRSQRHRCVYDPL